MNLPERASTAMRGGITITLRIPASWGREIVFASPRALRWPMTAPPACGQAPRALVLPFYLVQTPGWKGLLRTLSLAVASVLTGWIVAQLVTLLAA